MVKCPKCNKQLSEDAKFCDNCGARIYQTIFCPNCGEQASTEFAFCQHCGASLGEKPTENRPALASVEKKKSPKKTIVFGGIGVAVIAVIIAAVFLFSSGRGENSNSNYALYLKDKEIFFTDLKKDSEAWQLTTRLINSSDMDDEDLFHNGYSLASFTFMSENGKYIFFPDKVSDGYDSFNLYYKEIANPETDAVKIDSNISSYTVNTSANIVTYLKGDEGNLYQYHTDEDSKDKIASEVRRFQVSDDGKKIVYINSEDSIYLKYADKDKEKIASNVSSLEQVYVTGDFTTVYYVKDDSLYKQPESEDKVKIASNVSTVLKIYDSGEIYYLTSKSGEISLMDYVTDDMKDADASITEPTYPDYPNAPSRPSRLDYAAEAEYDAAYEAYEDAYEAYKEECDRLYAEYEAAYQVFAEKQSRDELREALEEETLDHTNASLCFFNGVEEIVITDAVVTDNWSMASDTPVISYEAYNQSNLDKVKLSDIESIYEVKDLVEAALFSSSERYITVKDTATVIEREEAATHFIINSSGTIVYYIDDIPDGENYGELYRISISDGVVGKPEVYDSDVCTWLCGFVSDNAVKYFKDCAGNNGELYINKNKIDSDVCIDSIHVYTDLNKIIYFTDWNIGEKYGTLKVYQGEEAVKIADNVHDCSVTTDGRILYSYDYSLKYHTSELREWRSGETRKIDDDVICLLTTIDGKYRGDDGKTYGGNTYGGW